MVHSGPRFFKMVRFSRHSYSRKPVGPISSVRTWVRTGNRLRWIAGALLLSYVYWIWPWLHEHTIRPVVVVAKPCLPPVDMTVSKEFWHSNFGTPENTPVKVTVVIAGYSTSGFRPKWLESIVTKYVSQEYEDIIDQVILIWNNPDEPPPELDGVNLLVMKKNSLNNRWIEPLEHVRTDAILILDDDLMVDKIGIACMLSWWMERPDRLVGPYARYLRESKNYFAKDMFFSKAEYKAVLPRAMMFHKSFIKHYSNATKEVLDSVTRSHCDDMLMNVVATHTTGKPPLRVQLPAGSITDYFELCRRTERSKTGGLSLKSGWRKNRNECTYYLQKEYGFPLKLTDEVGVCHPVKSGNKPNCRVSSGAWTSMFSRKACSEL